MNCPECKILLTSLYYAETKRVQDIYVTFDKSTNSMKYEGPAPHPDNVPVKWDEVYCCPHCRTSITGSEEVAENILKDPDYQIPVEED